MDPPPVPKPRSAFTPQNEPLARPIPLPRTKVPTTTEKVTASDIFKSIGSVSRQISEDVAQKVTNSAKSANEKIEKSIQGSSKFAKDTLEKTITTSRAVRNSVTKSVIEGTRSAGLKLRKSKKSECSDDPYIQRCVSMPAVDLSLFDNIQFNSPLLEQKRFCTGIENNVKEHPNWQLNTSNFDDLSIFSSNSDNTDLVSNISYDISKEIEKNMSCLTLDNDQPTTYDIPKQSRTNSIVSSMSSASGSSCPDVPERSTKRDSKFEVMRHNSMYENWTLPFQASKNSKLNNTNLDNTPSNSQITEKISKSALYEFDPLQSSTLNQMYQGVSNELILLESFLVGDTYGTIVANDSTDGGDEQFEFGESEYFNLPIPPERSDSLFPEEKTNVRDNKNCQWFDEKGTDTKAVTEIENKTTNRVMQRFSHMLKLDKSKTPKSMPAKVEVIKRPPVNSLPVPYFSGMLTKTVSGVVEDLFKNSQTRYCVLSDQKLMCYTDPSNSVLKEAYTLNNIYSLQIVLPLSSR